MNVSLISYSLPSTSKCTGAMQPLPLHFGGSRSRKGGEAARLGAKFADDHVGDQRFIPQATDARISHQ